MFDKDLLKLLGKNKKYLFVAVIFMILKALGNLGLTASVCYALAVAFEGLEPMHYLYATLSFLGCLALRYIFGRLSDESKDAIGRQAKKELRLRAYSKIVALGGGEGSGMGLSGLSQISLEGIEQLDLYYSTYLPQFFYSMIFPFILFAILAPLEWHAALVLLCCVPLIPISIIAVSKYAKKVFAKYWGQYISMGDGFLDAIQGLRDLFVYKADAREAENIDRKAEDFRKVTMKVLVMQLASVTIMDLVAYGGAAAGISLSLISLSDHVISPAVALFVVLVAVEFFLPLRALGSAFHVAMNGVSAGRKIMALLETPEVPWGAEIAKAGPICANHVDFAYEEDRPILKDVTLSFKEKGLTAIVGESGSGKSTIASLILGMIDPNKGEISLGNEPIKSYSRESYFGNIGWVGTSTHLFNLSIRDNFHLANPSLSDAQIKEALLKVNLGSLLEEHGLDYVISEDSKNISGGERQRMALAISLSMDKPIYIFDEATSNIDIDSEATIIDSIYSLAKDKTLIMISHRLENVVRADKIYFLEDGKIIEEGTHGELLEKKGSYASLYLTQKSLEQGYKEAVHG